MAQSTHNRDYQLLLAVLKAARKRVGVTQIELAERLGNTQTFVSKCERGGGASTPLSWWSLPKPWASPRRSCWTST